MFEKFTTKRFIFSSAGLGLATLLVYQDKMTCECWVYALAIILAGHHAEDLIRAWKGAPKQ